jgi:aspartyl-tRNA(Asn)/glutamyl-tRNA(Gln) amidotransferase subunit A
MSADRVITRMTAVEIASGVRAGELSPAEVAASFRERVKKYDGTLGAFLRLNGREPPAKADGPLAGVPVAVKDCINTDWLVTTAGSKILENYRPPYNATVVDRVLDAGGYVLGKTNLDEFAMGSSNEYSAFFPARNPHDVERVPGGSSGGSAVAVAAGLAPLALGTETGGSVRLPSSMCGVVGLKTTYGLVSRYGLIAFGPSLDQIGPMGRTVEDVASLLNVIAGPDPRDATSAREAPPDYVARSGEDFGDTRVGVINEFYDESVEVGVRERIEDALGLLEKAGHAVERASFPGADWALPTYYVDVCAEVYSNLARYQGTVFGERAGDADMIETVAKARGAGFGPEVKRRIIAGAYALSVGYRGRYYEKAQAIRRDMRARFAEVFEKFDFLVAPVSPFTAFRLGERVTDPQQMYLADIFTCLANLIWAPALSLPCGFDSKGLPVGMQIIGRHFDEARLLAFARRLEGDLGLDKAPVDPAI